MRYLLDTNQWSYLQRGEARMVSRIRSLPPDAALFMSVVAQAELLTGVLLVDNPARQRHVQ